MLKKYFTYADVLLDKRGVYTPSHTLYFPNLAWKVEVIDEVLSGISTPNSILNFGYINIIDPDSEASVNELLTLPNMHWIKEITVDEARTILDTNWYVHDGNYVYTIQDEYIDEITWETVPAKTIQVI